MKYDNIFTKHYVPDRIKPESTLNAVAGMGLVVISVLVFMGIAVIFTSI